ncbi:MAG: hypothetical protein WBX11_16410 [Thiobacillaceae bacterium]
MPNMGINLPAFRKPAPPPRQTGLADALFTGTQQRVLGLIFGQPGRSFYATELIGLAGSGSGAVQRELALRWHVYRSPAIATSYSSCCRTRWALAPRYGVCYPSAMTFATSASMRAP